MRGARFGLWHDASASEDRVAATAATHIEALIRQAIRCLPSAASLAFGPMPGVGFEPTRDYVPTDFKSDASTGSATPARGFRVKLPRTRGHGTGRVPAWRMAPSRLGTEPTRRQRLLDGPS